MKITIIDYGAGNIQSIIFSLKRLGIDAVLSDNFEEISASDKIIFPGVGQASSAMDMLKKSKLDVLIPELKQPILGICLGMQLMCKSSEESYTKGLSIFDCEVIKFPSTNKVPQVGWNTISNLKSLLFKDISEKSYIYLVHSFYVPICRHAIATINYNTAYSGALQNKNFYGVQFHPEKSSNTGRTILKNFIEL